MAKATTRLRSSSAISRALAFALAIGASIGLPALAPPASNLVITAAMAQPAGDTAEKEAFAAAKELGTVDAWEAFLTNYPNGFRADLARAYVKKLGAAAPSAAAPPPAPAPSGTATPAGSAPASSSPNPFELASQVSCGQVGKLKSYQSTDPVKLRFVNQSEATRVIQWVDFNGALKEYFTLQPGEQRVVDTFLTHPWIAAYEEGSCAQMFMPGQPESIAVLQPDGAGVNPDAALPSRPPKTAASGQPSKKTIERRAAAACADIGMAYINGQCAPKKKSERKKAARNKGKPCPGGMYRNPYGQCQPNETGG